MDNSKLSVLKTFSSAGEASIYQSLLESNGIRCELLKRLDILPIPGDLSKSVSWSTRPMPRRPRRSLLPDSIRKNSTRRAPNGARSPEQTPLPPRVRHRLQAVDGNGPHDSRKDKTRLLLSGALLQLSARRTGMPGACGKGSRIFCRPRTACREKASATYRTSGRSLDLKIKSGTNRMPRQTDTAEPFPRDDTHATSRQRNDTLTSLPSMPLIPTRNGPYFAKQNRDDAPPAVPKPQRLPRHDPEYPTAHGYPRFSLIYAPASLYKTDYIPHHEKERSAQQRPNRATSI